MLFNIPRNELAIAVTNAVHGVPNNPNTPVRAGMHIAADGDRLTFSASDGDVTFSASVIAERLSGEKITVPGKLFADVVRSLPDKPVIFASNEETATITCGRGEFRLPVYPSEYPSLPVPASFNATVDATVFSNAVRKVIPAASKSDSSPALSAILLEPDGDTLWAAATDRYRLAAVQIPWESQDALKSALVPAWAADRFTRGAEGTVSLGWDDRVVTLSTNEYTVTSRLIQGDFPSWRKLLSPHPCVVEVNAEDLTGALRRAQLASEQDSPVELTFLPGELHVEAGMGNRATDVLNIKYDGEEFRVLFGITNLSDGLSGCDVASFGFTEPLKPVYIQSGNYHYTLVPRRKL